MKNNYNKICFKKILNNESNKPTEKKPTEKKPSKKSGAVVKPSLVLKNVSPLFFCMFTLEVMKILLKNFLNNKAYKSTKVAKKLRPTSFGMFMLEVVKILIKLLFLYILLLLCWLIYNGYI